MRIRLALLVILVLSVVSIVPSVAADSHADRFALVIGNAKYPDAEAPLKEPINDARDLADELKRDGFSVEVGENLTGDAMRRAFDAAEAAFGTVTFVEWSQHIPETERPNFIADALARYREVADDDHTFRFYQMDVTARRGL